MYKSILLQEDMVNFIVYLIFAFISMEGEVMNYKMRELINNLTEDIIESYNLNIQDDIDSIVNLLGGKIEEMSEFTLFDGEIIKTGNKGFVIRVSHFQSETRRRFTIAHEIGHLFLHMGYIIDEEKWNKIEIGVPLFFRRGSSTIEYEANEFAAALLMPRQEYKIVLESNTCGLRVNTAEIAKHFNVSEEAASLRGKFLGFLEW